MPALQKTKDQTYYFRCLCGIIVQYAGEITLCMCGTQWLRFDQVMVYLISCHNCGDKLAVERPQNAEGQGWKRIRIDTDPPGPWKNVCPQCVNLERPVPHQVE